MIWKPIRLILSDPKNAIVSQETLKRTLRATVGGFYGNVENDTVVFDNNRGWPAELPGLIDLFPQARLICCVRSPAWILDSMERQLSKNYWNGDSSLFPRSRQISATDDVYSRTEFFMKEHLVGPSLRLLRSAWFSDLADRLICIRYESLTARPQETINSLYDILEEPHFDHHFKGIQYDQQEYDNTLGLPGFHAVRPDVLPNNRATILPPDIFKMYDRCFWNDEGENPRGITIL